jgi:hypothetical protein
MSRNGLAGGWIALAPLVLFIPPAFLGAQGITSPTAPAGPKSEREPFTWSVGYFLRPMKLDELTLREQANAIPQPKKDRVHFFLINGFDPLYLSNLKGMAAYCQAIGFTNTTCGPMTSTWNFRRQIATVRRSNPEARIVLLGYSLGANCARSVANSLKSDGIAIDCLIYVGGDTIANTPESRPSNVGHVVNITGHGFVLLGGDLFLKGDQLDRATNQRLDARHFALPGQRECIEKIGQELIRLANEF